MTIKFGPEVTQDFSTASSKEWLETNGLGGWASSTITGAHTRRYHGLFVPAFDRPENRRVVVSKLDATVFIGTRYFELSSNINASTVRPKGFQYLHSFQQKFFPEFEFHCGATKIRKTVAAINGENTVLVFFEIIESPEPIKLRLQPLFTNRAADNLGAEHRDLIEQFEVINGRLQFAVLPEDIYCNLTVPAAEFKAKPQWVENICYPLEKFRGLDFAENLFSPGSFMLRMEPGQKIGVKICLDDGTPEDVSVLLQQEQQRREKLHIELRHDDTLTRQLSRAADQFIVKADNYQRTIIGGYHWLGQSSRFAMIALPGLCLPTGRFEDARKILRMYSQHVDAGMLPDFPAPEKQSLEFTNADAVFWFVLAIYKYWQYTGDFDFIRQELLAIIEDVVLQHQQGTRHGIQIDNDKLLFSGKSGMQLTWMDAEVHGWGVTPRHGKAVEINALWFNALKILASFKKMAGDREAGDHYENEARDFRKSFQEKFWNEQNHCLFDYIDRNHSDEAIRPNQIFALSLPFPLFDGPPAEQILKVVTEKLFTMRGLRSLAQSEPAYRTFYGGNSAERNSSYHQGTVWAWLMGPYISALVRECGQKGKMQASQIIERFKVHIAAWGIGSISEIFGAEPPHNPRGCIAHAASVGEFLRAYT